jgi:hypothetical protein
MCVWIWHQSRSPALAGVWRAAIALARQVRKRISPQRLCWSLSADKRLFDLADPHQVRAAYEYVIDAARTQADLSDWLNASLLASVWGQLGCLGRHGRGDGRA